MKVLLIAIIAIFIVTGCTRTVEKLVYVTPSCPVIKVLKVVPKIDGNITNGCVCDDQLDNLLIGAGQLRKSETYYREQITKYNSKFTKKKK